MESLLLATTLRRILIKSLVVIPITGCSSLFDWAVSISLLCSPSCLFLLFLFVFFLLFFLLIFPLIFLLIFPLIFLLIIPVNSRIPFIHSLPLYRKVHSVLSQRPP